MVQRNQALTFDAGVNDYQALIEHWGVGRAPATTAVADNGVPDCVAIEIETIDAGLAEERRTVVPRRVVSVLLLYPCFELLPPEYSDSGNAGL